MKVITFKEAFHIESVKAHKPSNWVIFTAIVAYLVLWFFTQLNLFFAA